MYNDTGGETDDLIRRTHTCTCNPRSCASQAVESGAPSVLDRWGPTLARGVYNPDPMPLQRFPLSDYKGGLNFRDGPFDLDKNETPDALNVTLTDLVGQLQVRGGKASLGTAFPGGRIDNIVPFNLPGASPGVMASINGKIYTCSSSGFAWTLRFTGTAGSVWDFAQLEDNTGSDWVWCMNGVDPIQKWQGGATTTAAVAATMLLGTANHGGTRCLVYKNKLIVANVAGAPGYRIFLSSFGDPEGAVVGNVYDTTDIRGPGDEGAAVTELNVLADRLIVFKSKSVWSFTDVTSGANRRVGEPGCFGRFQSAVCANKLWFLNEQGVWSTNGLDVSLESGQLGNFFPSKDVPVSQSQVNLTQLGLARLMCTRDSYPRLLACLPMGPDLFNSRVMEVIPNINFRRIGGRRYILLPAFLLHTFPASCLSSMTLLDNAHIIVGGDDLGAGKAYSYFVPGQTDDGVEITGHWLSSWIGVQEQEPLERLRRLNAQISGDAQVDVYVDFNNVTSVFTGQFLSDAAWDGGVWNDGTPWDSIGYGFRRVRPETRGRYHAIKVSTVSGGIPFSVANMELALRGGKEH